MVKVIENTRGKVRDLPIAPRLKQILSLAGTAAGIDEVVVESGGQCALGTCTKRTGSTRHDLGNAADLDLRKNGRTLKFTNSSDLVHFQSFVEAAASFGATGIGGDVGYMGASRLHVGFGSRATWGGNGGTGEAPAWLASAARRGWNSPSPIPPSQADPSMFTINARDGLNLRSGPGVDFSIIRLLPLETTVSVLRLDGPNQEWAQIDLDGDGVADGYVFKTFLKPSQPVIASRSLAFQPEAEVGDEGCAEDCEVIEEAPADFHPCGLRAPVIEVNE
jgi:hypothetical protein